VRQLGRQVDRRLADGAPAATAAADAAAASSLEANADPSINSTDDMTDLFTSYETFEEAWAVFAKYGLVPPPGAQEAVHWRGSVSKEGR